MKNKKTLLQKCYEKMMIAKFQARTKATDYDPESSEDVRFIGWFESFIDKIIQEALVTSEGGKYFGIKLIGKFNKVLFYKTKNK